MRALLASLLASLALAAPTARAAAPFDSLAGASERLDALEPFLIRYVGQCRDVYERRTCEANVEAARRAAKGKTFSVRIADAAPLIQPQLRGAGFVLLLTPFVDGGGVALTNGAPLKQDAEGHPLVGLIPIEGRLPPGMMEMEFESPFRTGAIELEIVFQPVKSWKLKRKGDAGSYEGVAARFLAVRVLDARTGAPIADKVL